MSAASPADAAVLQFLNPEVRALIEGIQGRGPDSLELDWDRLVRLAVAHGVAPLLHRQWSATQGVPLAVLDAFVQVRRQSALNGAIGLCERDEILRLLDDAHIPFLVLKGAALARTWYADISLRPFLDIDLWVSESKLPEAGEALARAGYKPMSHPGAVHHEVPLHRGGSPCSVELHHRLTFLPLHRVLRFEDFSARGMQIDGEIPQLRTLSVEDTLIHLCLHCLADMAYTHGWRLRHLVDIRQHLEVFDVDWSVFQKRVQALGVRKACGAVLGLAALVANAHVPGEQIDVTATVDLLHHPMPGAIAHQRVAAFLAALRQGNPRLAGIILLEKMAEGRRIGHWNVSELRPYLLLPAAVQLLRELVTEPERLETQLRDWLPETRSWEQTDELVAGLLAAPGNQPARHILPHRHVGTGQLAQGPAAKQKAGGSNATSPVVLAVLVVLLTTLGSRLLRAFIRTVRVRGSSMEPTLHAGQRLLINAAAYRGGAPLPGSIVVVRDPRRHGHLAIKRVVGLPGQTVKIRKGRVWIDGRLVSETRAAKESGFSGSATIPPDEYFVLGDNWAVSVDSRSWGPLPRTLLVGKVEFSYWPPSSWGRVSSD